MVMTKSNPLMRTGWLMRPWESFWTDDKLHSDLITAMLNSTVIHGYAKTTAKSMEPLASVSSRPIWQHCGRGAYCLPDLAAGLRSFHYSIFWKTKQNKKILTHSQPTFIKGVLVFLQLSTHLLFWQKQVVNAVTSRSLEKCSRKQQAGCNWLQAAGVLTNNISQNGTVCLLQRKEDLQRRSSVNYWIGLNLFTCLAKLYDPLIKTTGQ